MASVEITAQQSGLYSQLNHGPSGSGLRTAAPRDNAGDASSFSPTDLVAAALASCALTTMVIIARRENIPLPDGARARIEKEMTASGPRRIGKLTLHIDMPAGVKPEHRARLEEIARGCPVARSLHPDMQVPMTFSYA